MSDSKWFIISNLSEFTDKARAIVYNNFGVWQNKSDLDVIIDDVVENEKEEFDKILSHQESLVIVKENINNTPLLEGGHLGPLSVKATN